MECEWSSPGGERKVFTCGSISISWLKNKKFLSLDGFDENIINKLWAIGCRYKCRSEVKDTTMSNKSTTENLSSVEVNPCSCCCQGLSAEIEGVKLDMVISEAKIESNANWINNVCEELAEIRKENNELRCLINRLKNENTSRPSDGEDDVLVALKKSNAILVDNVETLTSSVSSWKTKANEIEERSQRMPASPIARPIRPPERLVVII